MGPHAGETGQQVLILGQLHLEAALPGPGPLGKDVQNQGAAVQHLDPQLLGEHPELGGAEIVVKDDCGGRLVLHQLLDLRHLALADEGAGIRAGPVLEHGGGGLAAGGLHQGLQLRHGLLVGVVPGLQPGAGEAGQDGDVPGLLQFFRFLFSHSTSISSDGCL